MTYLDHEDIYQVLAAHPGHTVEYGWISTAAAGHGAMTVTKGRVAANYADTESIVTQSQGRRGSIVEEHFQCPHTAFKYSFVALYDNSGALLHRLGDPGSPQPKSASQEQREAIFSAVHGSAVTAENQRSELAQLIKQMEQRATEDRAAQQATAERQRLTMLEEQRAAAARQAQAEQRAAAERKQMLEAFASLQKAFTAGAGAQDLPRRTRPSHNHDSSSSDSSDDDVAATDIDDEASCTRARANWRERVRNTPKQRIHLSAWTADGVSQADYQTRWARKLELPSSAGQRDVNEALAIEAILVALHRALLADAQGNRQTAVYAVQTAMETAMTLAQKLQMRTNGASAEALTAFDVEHAAVTRQCRRRPELHQTIEQLAATAVRKHPKKPRREGDRDKNRRGGDRGGDGANSSAASTRANTPAAAVRKAGP